MNKSNQPDQSECHQREILCLPVMSGSPFVRSKQTGFHCRSRRPVLWLHRTAGHVEAPGRKHAGRTEHPTHPSGIKTTPNTEHDTFR